jgi:molybdenum cofactor biosynthesis enzyme MoaA
MLVNIENTNEQSISKLVEFAKEHQMKLSFIDDKNDYWLPGKPLTENELTQVIEKSRTRGMISMKDAHTIIRQNKHAD